MVNGVGIEPTTTGLKVQFGKNIPSGVNCFALILLGL